MGGRVNVISAAKPPSQNKMIVAWRVEGVRHRCERGHAGVANENERGVRRPRSMRIMIRRRGQATGQYDTKAKVPLGCWYCIT